MALPVSLSFEFFPPKTEEMEQKLWQSVTDFAPLSPSFVSVTYGAGGSTRERTHHTVKRILQETRLKPAAHLTCIGSSCEDIKRIAQDYWNAGVRHIVALRGDLPQDNAAAAQSGYAYACELVAALKKIADFEISVAAFPEKHPESSSFDADLDYLEKKIEAGATRAITQYFFDVDHYFRLVERIRARGITIPIVPGILPIGNFAQMKKFSRMCGASVPAWLESRFEGLDQNPTERHKIAIEVAAAQGQALMAFGAEHLHFYTLNRADLTSEICHILQGTAR